MFVVLHRDRIDRYGVARPSRHILIICRFDLWRELVFRHGLGFGNHQKPAADTAVAASFIFVRILHFVP